jgi:DNA-binding cell septation regulator SpoVG
MNMKITEVRIRPANKDLVKAYVTVCFDKATQEKNEKTRKDDNRQNREQA